MLLERPYAFCHDCPPAGQRRLAATEPAASAATPVDRHFGRWACQGAQLSDPNEIGDADWRSDLLDEGFEHHYLRLLSPDAVIPEMGPAVDGRPDIWSAAARSS